MNDSIQDYEASANLVVAKIVVNDNETNAAAATAVEVVSFNFHP